MKSFFDLINYFLTRGLSLYAAKKVAQSIISQHKVSNSTMSWSLNPIDALMNREVRLSGPDTKYFSSAMNFNNDGNTRYVTRSVRKTRKRFKLSKLVNSSVNYTEQQLGVRGINNPYTWGNKHLISEFGINGGFMGICMNSRNPIAAAAGPPVVNPNIGNTTPMHIYDLNFFIGATEDNDGNFPQNTVINVNENTNGRAWYWNNNNYWSELHEEPNSFSSPATAGKECRYYINDPRTELQDANPSTKIYRKAIKVDFNVYACKAMATEYKFDIIKITDPKMVPDPDIPHNDTMEADQLNEYRQNWQNLIRAYTINPVLKGIEPGPGPVQPWFKIVASKKIRLGEQTGEVNSLPSVQGRIHLNLNEVNNYAWTNKGFTLESGDSTYDGVPLVETGDIGNNNTFKHKPYYTSRYYLLIRALCPIDNALDNTGDDANVDFGTDDRSGTVNNIEVFKNNGIPTTTYQPSYDLCIRTSFLTMNAN